VLKDNRRCFLEQSGNWLNAPHFRLRPIADVCVKLPASAFSQKTDVSERLTSLEHFGTEDYF
jgi:hypothetical protein